MHSYISSHMTVFARFDQNISVSVHRKTILSRIFPWEEIRPLWCSLETKMTSFCSLRSSETVLDTRSEQTSISRGGLLQLSCDWPGMWGGCGQCSHAVLELLRDQCGHGHAGSISLWKRTLISGIQYSQSDSRSLMCCRTDGRTRWSTKQLPEIRCSPQHLKTSLRLSEHESNKVSVGVPQRRVTRGAASWKWSVGFLLAYKMFLWESESRSLEFSLMKDPALV